MKTIKVALVGQPNAGKSSLINTITGASLHVGNFSGVTVEKKEIVFQRDDYQIQMIDLPGLYSLKAFTPEESVSKNFLLYEKYDIIVNVADANALTRNLILTTQLLDFNKKMVLAVNMYDEVQKNGGSIDEGGLSTLLGIPVSLVSSKEKSGIENLINKIIDCYENEKNRSKTYYNEMVEDEIKNLQNSIKNSDIGGYDSRFVVIRLLEEDEDFYKMIHDKAIFMDFVDSFNASKKALCVEFDEEDTFSVLQQIRSSYSNGVVNSVCKQPQKNRLTDKIDKILIHPIAGLPIFLFFMWLLFQATIVIGGVPADFIESSFGVLGEYLKTTLPPSALTDAFCDGALPAVSAVIMFLPNILILFLGINLLEQTVYMARSAFLLDGFLKRFGLQGKAFIPLVSGFGCSIPAYMAARTLKNPKDRLITMLVIGFFSCSARLPVYVLFIGAFFEESMAGNILFLIYIVGAILAMFMSKILRTLLFRGEPEPFVMEMPKYRLPSFKAIARDLKIKGLMFIKKAGLFIAIASMIVWFLSAYPKNTEIETRYNTMIENATNEKQKELLHREFASKMMEMSFLGQFGKAIEPVFAPLGFDWKMSVATVSALAAKEVAVSTLATLYSIAEDENSSLIQKIRENISFPAALAFIVVIMIYSPCLAAMGTFYAEVPQLAWRVFYTIYPNVVAWILAFLTYNVANMLGL